MLNVNIPSVNVAKIRELRINKGYTIISSWADHRTNEWVLSRLEVEKSLLARIRKLKLSYYGHIMKKANCLEKDIIQGCVPGSRGRGDQGDDGGRISVTGRDFGSTMQQDLRKTWTIGEGSYVPPTLQLEHGNI